MAVCNEQHIKITQTHTDIYSVFVPLRVSEVLKAAYINTPVPPGSGK